MVVDAYGKILRVGDRVHRITARRSVKKGRANGRVLPELRTFTVKLITESGIVLRGNPGRIAIRNFLKYERPNSVVKQ